MDVRTIGDRTVLVASENGPPVGKADDALDFVGDAMASGATMVAIPIARLHPEFLDLSTRRAGEVIQKFTNYRLDLAIVGDISAALARSEALRAFVIESNRGRGVRFVGSLDDL